MGKLEVVLKLLWKRHSIRHHTANGKQFNSRKNSNDEVVNECDAVCYLTTLLTENFK